MDKTERIAQLREAFPGLQVAKLANGLEVFSAEVDFCGDEPYKNAFEIARELKCRVHYEGQPNAGIPAFRFVGTLAQIEALAGIYF